MRRRRSAFADLALGARLAVAGGAPSRVRALMTALGVGLGVVVLLVAASVPAMVDRHDARVHARTPVGESAPTKRPALLVTTADTRFHGHDIRGLDVRPTAPGAPRPPGLARLPRAGEVLVSPRLAALLRRPDASLLRERLGARVTGTIGDAGLSGPAEYAFYRGAPAARRGGQAVAQRVIGFGANDQGASPYQFLLDLLVAVAVVVLLMPIGVFVGSAVRFGGDDRDRRLAALRLVGADRAMATRIAAGETLVGAVLGLAVGAASFFAVRPLLEHVRLSGLSVFAEDVRPAGALVVLIAVLVPVAAAVVSLLALRKVVIEPLGVVRRAAVVRRRLWWRLLPAGVGVALIAQLHGNLGQANAECQIAAGVLFVLVGLTAVLPWVVEAAVRNLRGGPVSWQLATRRLHLDGGTAARVVSGIAVAVAGAIALQAVFSAAERDSTYATGADPGRADYVVRVAAGGGVSAAGLEARLRRVAGVAQAPVTAAGDGATGGSHRDVAVLVGGCAALRERARIGSCRDGDSFIVKTPADAAYPRPVPRGTRLVLGTPDGTDTYARSVWRVPSDARVVGRRTDPTGALADGILATPGALPESRLHPSGLTAFVKLGPGAGRDAIERVRNVALALDPGAGIGTLAATDQYRPFTSIRRGISAGAVAVLVLIGASLLVSALEQLRERRRVLAVLVAFGTRRTTLATSVLWQAAVPVVLGLGVSVAVGVGLGALLLTVADEPIVLDVGAFAEMAAAGAVVVLGVTALSMPVLWRLMRPDGLRTE